MQGCLCLLTLALLVQGCTSISSTMLSRNNCNTDWDKCQLKGYPITLRVPTHIRLDIIHRTYMAASGKPLQANGSDMITVNFRTHIIETDKMFTTDYKRPLSGALEHSTRFTPDGYIDSIQYSANDDTIAQSSIAAQRLLTNVISGGQVAAVPVATPKGLLGSVSGDVKARRRPAAADVIGPSGATQDPAYSAFSIVETLAATAIFELDAPDLEQRMGCFIQQHCSPQQL